MKENKEVDLYFIRISGQKTGDSPCFDAGGFLDPQGRSHLTCRIFGLTERPAEH
jgi:hypothetical protein